MEGTSKRLRRSKNAKLALQKEIKIVEEQIRNEEKRLECYICTIRSLEGDNYDSKNLGKMLEEETDVTLKALLWASEEGIIDVHSDLGKRIWKETFRYLSDDSMKDWREPLEEEIFSLHSPGKKEKSDNYLFNLGHIYKALTFGILNANRAFDDFRRKKYHNFIKKKFC